MRVRLPRTATETATQQQWQQQLPHPYSSTGCVVHRAMHPQPQPQPPPQQQGCPEASVAQEPAVHRGWLHAVAPWAKCVYMCV